MGGGRSFQFFCSLLRLHKLYRKLRFQGSSEIDAFVYHSSTIISLELSIRHTTSFWQINASMKRGRKCSLTLAGRRRLHRRKPPRPPRPPPQPSPQPPPQIVSLWLWVVCEHWASYIWQNMLFPRSIDSRLNTFGWCDAGPSEKGGLIPSPPPILAEIEVKPVALNGLLLRLAFLQIYRPTYGPKMCCSTVSRVVPRRKNTEACYNI